MRAFEFSRVALSACVVVAILSACGGGSSVPVAAGSALLGATRPTHHQTFSYTGAEQTFTVPAGVTRLTVIARGGEGIGYFYHGSGYPGFPGRVYAVIRVHPGIKLYVFVAGSGRNGGFNGGGGGTGTGGFGGGASDVRLGGDALKDRVVVAAGGGTAGGCDLYCYDGGGNGGGLNGKGGFDGGGPISGGGGGGGTQTAGGQGGAGGVGHRKSENGQPGGNGKLGVGGAGGKGGPARGHYQYGIDGGGGGGGYYGGGGGGGSATVRGSSLDWGSGGGGGGSSYVTPHAITSRMWTGWKAVDKGDGQIIISWK